MNTKRVIKTVSLAMAGVAACTAIGFGVKGIVDYTKEDLKTITPSFEVGSLGADGKFVFDEGVLYTKEAFGCYGLQIKPDFDSTVNYQIFYYDILDNYISSTEVFSGGYSGEAPLNGAYARMVILPQNDEDGKISWTEKIDYPKQLTVKVKKEQDINKRFVCFKGRVLGVVDNPESLVFINHLAFSDNTTLVWGESASYASTASTVLKLNSGDILNFSFSSLEEKFNNAYCYFYEFSGLPSMENYICYKKVGASDPSFRFDSKTKYIIISVSTGGDFEWDDVGLSKLPLCFGITKSK